MPQLYLNEAAGDKRVRLLGFERVELAPAPGKSCHVTTTAEPRLLARFEPSGHWHIAAGTYRVAVGKSAYAFALTSTTTLVSRRFGN